MLLIFALLVAFLCIIYLTAQEKKKLYQTRIRKNSKRYRALLKLNEAYCFDDSLKPVYFFEEWLNSKQQYDRFDFDKHLKEKIKIDKVLCDEIIQKSYDNRRLLVAYQRQLDQLPPAAAESLANAVGVPYTFFRNQEELLCEELMRIPVCFPKIEYQLHYRSAHGRNEYLRNKEYSFDEWVFLRKRIDYEEESRNTAEYQRKRMTDSLRYDVFKRDGFRCVICGRTASDGIKLHVDHIKPVSKGGKTELSNLRTLCNACNFGKRDKYDESGIN